MNLNQALTQGVSQRESLGYMMRQLAEVATRMLAQMWSPEDPRLFCQKLRDDHGTLIAEGVSLRYSLIAWIGLHSVYPEQCRNSRVAQAAWDGFMNILRCELERFTVGELGLLAWLSSARGNSELGEIGDSLHERWSRHESIVDSVETAWVVTGLAQNPAVFDGSRVFVQSLKRLLKAYNSETHLFVFNPSASKVSPSRRYRSIFGSFAAQVYPLLALALLNVLRPNDRLRGIVREVSSQLCELQGLNGEWWWIYDTRNSTVIMDYPVYSVHQDAMGPMALLASMLSGSESRCVDAVHRSVGYLFTKGVTDPLFEAGRDMIWRAVVKDIPGEDPADLPFGIGRKDMRHVTLSAWTTLGPAPTPTQRFRLLKEARPYCPGWILFTFSLLRKVFPDITGVEECELLTR